MKTVTIFLALLVLGLTVIAQNPKCKATKRDGTPCKATILLPSGLCRAHDTTLTPHCGAPAGKDKHPCRQPVSKPGERCRFHEDGKVIKRCFDRGYISVVYWQDGRQWAEDYITPRKYARLGLHL